MATRKTRQVETRMTAEYLLEHYGRFPHLQAVALGAVDANLMAAQGYQKAIRMSRPYRPEVDAVVILPNYLLLIESKVWNVINGLAKLPLYKSLLPVTPELQQYMPREVLMQLVCGWSNSNLEIMARELGVQVVVYAPKWLQQIVEGMHKYWTPEYQAARSAKLAAREYFGVE